MMRSRFRPSGLGPVVITLAASTVGFLVAPLVAISLISFSSSRYLEFPPPSYSLRWYRAVLVDTTWSSALLLSTEVALVVAILATLLGGMAAFAFRRRQFKGRTLLLAAALSPLVVPGIVMAVGAYLMSARLGLLESRTALVLSHTILALPVVLITVMATLRTLDPRLGLAARSLGAGWFQSTWRVTIPAIRAGLISAFLFAFVTSFDEPVVALFIAGTRAITLPKRMWDGIQYELDPAAAAVSTLLIFISVLVVVLASYLTERK